MSDQPKLLQQLRTMADEIRLKVHLAEMDAKDAWSKLEPRLQRYEAKAEALVDQVADEFVSSGQELKKDISELLERVKSKTTS